MTARTPLSALLLLYCPALVILGVVALVADRQGFPVAVLTQDTATMGQLHPLTGMLSNLGVLLWCVAATACWFSAWLGFTVWPAAQPGKTVTISFLALSGALTAILLLDDFFLIHEALAPDYLGIDEPIVLLCYAVLSLTYVVIYRNVIRDTEYLLLLSAGGFFAVSVGIDLLGPELGRWRTLWEDGAKFLGIANWCLYYVKTALRFHYLAWPAK